MAGGASRIILDLLEMGEVDGVVAAGGSMSTSLALEAMRTLPMGLPKLVLSTIAFSPLVTPESVPPDLTMMLWPAGLYGLNRISRRVLDAAAGAIAGASETFVKVDHKKKTVGITSMGTSQLRYVQVLKPALEERGYDVAVFHTTGMGGRAFEQAIDNGLIDVALDLALVEIMDEVVGGVTTSGPLRLRSATKRGIPQIVGAGAISNFYWASGKPFPPELSDRKHHRHNQLLTVAVTSTEDKARLGKLVAERLNAGTGPTSVVIPLIGSIEGDRHPKSPFHDPEGGRAFSHGLRSKLREGIEVVDLDAHANDPEFCEKVLEIFDRMVGRVAASGMT
jgi:uncharacterized protein (UPF0261 family)